MSFSLFSPCIEDYNKKYVSEITTCFNNIDAKINEIIARVQNISKNIRYALGKPEEAGTHYTAIDAAYETNNFFLATLHTPLTSLSGQTFGTSKSCMDKFCTFAYAHYMLDKTPQNAYNVTLDSSQQQDFAEITQFFKYCGYIKMIDIFKFNPGATKVDQILLQIFTIQNGAFNEQFTPMATFFNKLMPSYIQSLNNEYQMLNAHVDSLLKMPDEDLKSVIPDIDSSSVSPLANKEMTPPVPGMSQQVARAAALTSPTVEALVDEQVVATAAAATVALNDTNKKDEDDEKVVAAAAAAAINLE